MIFIAHSNKKSMNKDQSKSQKYLNQTMFKDMLKFYARTKNRCKNAK